MLKCLSYVKNEDKLLDEKKKSEHDSSLPKTNSELILAALKPQAAKKFGWFGPKKTKHVYVSGTEKPAEIIWTSKIRTRD